MKYILSLLTVLLLLPCARAATVTFNLQDITGTTTDTTVTFTRLDMPFISGGILFARPTSRVASVDGVVSATLVQGVYAVSVTGHVFNIRVPAGSSTYSLSDVAAYISVYASAAEVSAGSPWTNISGVVTMIADQALTNRVEFISGAISASSNTVAKFGSSTTWSAGLLLATPNFGTNLFSVAANGGGILIGRGAGEYWGELAGNDALVAVSDTTRGGANTKQIILAATDGVGANTWEIIAGTNSASLRMTDYTGDIPLVMNPGVSSTGASYAYRFGSSHTLTNSETLIFAHNNFTNQFSVSAVSGYAGGGTKALTDAGTYKQFPIVSATTSGTATLSSGVNTVSTAAVTASSRVLLSVQSLGTVTAPKAVGVTARSEGVSFTITSADLTDTSTVAWQIIEP